jgi:hypothetical protein
MTTMLAEPPAASVGPTPPPLHPETLRHVREAVHDVLMHTPAWRALPPDVRREIAHDMVRLGAFLVDPDGTGSEAQPATATALAEVPNVSFDPGQTAGGRMREAGGAVAAQSGTAAFTEEISKVDFPKFVADLIHGTFDAIVTSSIKQMDAYTELLKNVTKSVDEYMRDNVTPNNARDYLAQQYPDHFDVDTAEGQPKLMPKEPPEGMVMPDFMKELGLPAPVDALDEDTVEQQLVPAARKRMAMDRQHLLMTMVLMGINRLVVTDGNINAKVLFELKTQDKVRSSANQRQNFSDTDTKTTSKFGWWFSPSTEEVETTNFTVATTRSDSSTAQVDLHTKLSGEVAVRFKSETFPLDKMADIIGVDKIGNQAVGSGRPLQQPAPAGPPPALAPPMFPTPAPPAAPAPAAPGR